MKIKLKSNSQETEKIFVTNTEPLREKLRELGFKQIKIEGSNLREVRTFEKDNKYIITGHGHMMLSYFDKDNKNQVFHRGRTISENRLKFFTKRKLI